MLSRSMFYYMRFSAVLYHLSHQGYHQFEAGCLGLKLETYRPFLTPHSQNHTIATQRPYIQMPLSFLPLLPSIQTMTLLTTITKDNDVVHELCADIYCDVSRWWSWNFGQWQSRPHNSFMQVIAICPIVFTSMSGKYSKRNKVLNCVAQITKQTRKHTIQGGYSEYSLFVNIFYRNSSQFTSQRTVTWWSHDPMVGLSEVWRTIRGKQNMECWSERCVRWYWVVSVRWRYTQLRGRIWRTQFYHF